MLKIALAIALLISIPPAAQAETRINEVMYDPEGDDNNKEYIEIYSDEDIDLSGFICGDSDSNDTLKPLKVCNSSFYLIVEDGFNLSGIDANIFSAGAAIGNNLGNSQDSVFLYYNRSIISSISYTDGCQSGYSLEYSNKEFHCSLSLGGTPGKENSKRNQSYEGIKIYEFFPDPEGDDDASMPDGEFIEIYNEGNCDVDMASCSFKDSSGRTLYITSTTTLGSTIIQSKGHLAVYTNGFSGLLNNEGFEELAVYDPDGNVIDKVSYGSSKEGLSWSLIEDIWQYRLPSPDKENYHEAPEFDSYFKIEGLEDVGSDGDVEFGDIFKVRFYVYKGDEAKSSIKLYVESKGGTRISKITKANLDDKFTNYSMALPIILEPNCNEKYGDGDYYVKVGWTSETEEKDLFQIKVKGINEGSCDKIYVEKKKQSGPLEYRLIECPGNANLEEDFNVKIELENTDDEDHLVDIYSYLFKGSKCYSKSRDYNKKTIMVRSKERKEFELPNKFIEGGPGGYKLKVKIRRDGQKTEKEITQDIVLLAPVETSEAVHTAIISSEEKEGQKASASKKEEDDGLSLVQLSSFATVYESSDFLIKNRCSLFIIAALSLLSIALLLKKL